MDWSPCGGLPPPPPAARRVPLVVLTKMDDESLSAKALREGAQDYLIKGQIDARGLVGALRKAVERKALDEALFDEKERAQVTLNSIRDAVLCTDVTGHITFLTAVAETMTCGSRQDAVGLPVSKVSRILDATSRETNPNPVEIAMRRNEIVHLPSGCLLVRRDEREVPIKDSVGHLH